MLSVFSSGIRGRLIYDATQESLTFRNDAGAIVFSGALKDIQVVENKIWWLKLWSPALIRTTIRSQFTLEVEGKKWNLNFYDSAGFFSGVYRAYKWRPILIKR